MFWSNKSDRLVQKEQVEIGDEPAVTLHLRPSQRARRLSLRVSRLDGRVTLTVPYGASRQEALEFARERADWIRSHLENTASELRPDIGHRIPVLGAPHAIVQTSGRATRLADGEIHVPAGDARRTAIRIEAMLKQQARQHLAAASDHYAAQVGRSFGRISLRDTRSRWGSCSSEGNLMYSWRLIMAPREVLAYVAAHEVSHLVHMDHSTAFWAQVETIFPNHKPARKWLRDHGSELHRYRFRD